MYQYDYGYDDYPDEYSEEGLHSYGSDNHNCGCGCECSCDRPNPPDPVNCIPGPTGPMEPRGAKGPQGSRGIQGPQGREGLQGLRGPQGVSGAQGVAGIQGLTGPSGSQGIQGPRGLTGATGSQGLQGPQGNTGPAGDSSASMQVASASMQSYSDKHIYPQDALTFDICNIQRGFIITDDYQSLQALQEGTYVVEFGCFISNTPCGGDAIALELNTTMVIEESRMPILCGNIFVTGVVILALEAKDSIRLVFDSAQELEICSLENAINAYVVIHQIN